MRYGRIAVLALLLTGRMFLAGQDTTVPEGEEIRLSLVGANPVAPASYVPSDTPASHFFRGIRADTPPSPGSAFLRSAFRQVYPGIDVFSYGDNYGLEYVFLVKPGADWSQIRLKFADAEPLEAGHAGGLVHSIGNVEVVQAPPVGFLITTDATEAISVSYLVSPDNSVRLSAPAFLKDRESQLNQTVLNAVPGGEQPGGPLHTFYVARFETTHDQFLRFLNDASMSSDAARGAFLYYDTGGNVWMNEAMQPGRDEIFQIGASRLVYRPDQPPGKRYDHVRNKDGSAPYAEHPIIGVSWYGAVKYCNWLTLYSGRGMAERCYMEGTNALDWAPVTATNWGRGQFSDGERSAWIKKKGFRLPMLDSDPADVSTNRYNEFYKMAAWQGMTNRLYGFGRDSGDYRDANVAVGGSNASPPSTRQVGSYNGEGFTGRTRTRRNLNYYGLYDINGNAAEWVTDPASTSAPLQRILTGGSFNQAMVPIQRVAVRSPADTYSGCGIRPVTTYMPSEYLRFHVLYTFHTGFETQALPQIEGELLRTMGQAPEEAPVEAIIEGGEKARQFQQFGLLYKEHPALTEATAGGEEDTGGGGGGGPTGGGGGGGGVLPPPAGLTLRVTAVAPGGSANITVSPLDIAARGNGTTTFLRVYTNGTTVDLTAAMSASGWRFLEWRINGAGFPGNADPHQQITLTANTTMTAVYEPPLVLTVNAVAPGGIAGMTISPNDVYGAGNGNTTLTRSYTNGTTVDITASTNASGWGFVEWRINGSGFPGNDSPYQQITMVANTTMTAIYAPPPVPGPWNLFVRASAPGNAAFVSVAPADTNSLGSGTTPFVRVYPDGTLVSLMAATNASGWQFTGWERNGNTFSGDTNRSQQVTMTNNITMMAMYRYVPPIIIDPPISAGGL